MVKQTFNDGYNLTYITAGDPDNPALVCLHGWTSHKGIWAETIDRLKDHYYCIAVDLLGFGDSDKPDDAKAYLIPAQAARILRLIDHLGIDRFSLIGHSMGGQISMTIAATHAPHRVERLINVAGVVSGRLMPIVEHLTIPLVMLRYHFPLLVNPLTTLPMHLPPLAYVIYRPWFYNMRRVPFNTWAEDRWHALKPSVRQSTHYAGYAIRNHDLRPHLAKITASTLTIFGHQDLTVPPGDGELVAEHVRDSLNIWYDDCGHFPMYENKSAFLRDVGTFLLQKTPVAP